MKAKGSPKQTRLAGSKETRSGSPKENRMRCLRCGGAMVFERFQATMEIFYAWRCVNCGEILDNVVARNRELDRAQKKKAVGE